MKITGFIWFDDVIEKIETKHHVIMSEAEEVFFNKPKFTGFESNILCRGKRCDDTFTNSSTPARRVGADTY
ncbi:MAG: hypothetical protein ONB46_04175 [candidate division KSB1 bacterium]|nr:hypothetical protein [candidate division KSB1 bacterium]MDZ7365184.1 hypothetical protein [candidate division KSB1 bacterium]MDZ7404394.1 hypothetical protein [candidate division KSB1 bacterium]